MQINKKMLSKEFDAFSRLPRDFNAEEECDHLKKIINQESLSLFKDYKEPHAEGAGGSGLVISAIYVPFGIRRAIKLPRKRIYEKGIQDSWPEDPELHALSKVSHRNITRLYDHVKLKKGKGSCIITDYVKDPKPFDKFCKDLCCTKECRENDFVREEALKKISNLIYEISDALLYMHLNAKLIHFDIKPDNILVSSFNNYVYITDLGFAKDLTKYKPEEIVTIGFTWKYAHPKLADPHHGGRISQTTVKSKNKLQAKEMSPIFDIFSFGRTLQETLFKIHKVHGDKIYSNYTFNYLHILACLCLDGRNAVNGSINGKSFVSDTAFGMPTGLFKEHKLEHFFQIKEILERLLGKRRLEDDLPETDPWGSATINVSDLGITTLTPRVKTVTEHPAFVRLSGELQLGMLDTVFPTATHSRLQHSLGVFHSVTEYIRALYYDPENPTFRILFLPKLGKKALLNAILHDLGQTSFGHELEEVDNEVFNQDKISKIILCSDYFKDSKGRTLKNIVEKKSFDCWDLDINEIPINNIRKPIEGIIKDIVIGQLDADKLDYLIRDSVECRVKYGMGIDYQRFLRSLTTCAIEDRKLGAIIRLAVKQKGAASAESFALARYQLYQSLYWHHSFRSIKAMFLTSAVFCLNKLKKEAQLAITDKEVLLSAYLYFLYNIEFGNYFDELKSLSKSRLNKKK